MGENAYFMVFQVREFGKWQDKEIYECNSQKTVKPIKIKEFNHQYTKYLERLRRTKLGKSRYRVVHRCCKITDL